MEPSAAPPDVVAALLTAGYRVLGPVGRGAQGPAWSAVALDGPPDRVVVRVVDLAADPRHGARLDRLRGVQHEHLARVRDVVAVNASAAALLVDHVPGPTLAALRSARGPLSAGEAVTLAVPLADALEALHAAGLVHGDVSPANVVIGLDGRPVLVDLLGALTPCAGTPGFAAPEVDRGEACEPAGDVHALARVVLAQLGPAGSGAGSRSDPAPSHDEQRVRDLLTAATDPDPRLRLAARELADACFRAHAPEPIAIPDGAVLARAELAGLASRSGRSTIPRRTSRHRGRRAWRAHAVRLVVALAAVVACGLLAFAVSQRGAVEAGAPTAPAAAPTAPAAAPTAPAAAPVASSGAVDAAAADPVDAARRLTVLRAEVISAGDAALLTSVEVPGSPAHVADAAILADLAARGLRIEGLSAAVAGVDLVSAATPRTEVAVTSTTSGYRLVRADGTIESTVPAGQQRTVVLVLEPTSDGLRVADVTDPAPTGDGA